MTDPASQPAAVPGRPFTLRQEWLLILICSLIVIGLEITAAVQRDEGVTLLTLLSTVTSWFCHAGWLSMDRRRRGLEIGAWRFGVIFFGPLAIWLYLIVEYRARALYLIPLTLAIYVALGGLILLGARMVTGLS